MSSSLLILCNPHFSLIILLYQTPPEKTSAQEQRSNNPTVGDDPDDADTQTVDSPTQQTVDGKKFICSFLSFYNKYKPKNFLMPTDTSIKSPEPIQPNIKKDIGTSSAVPSPQSKLLPKKVPCSPHHSSHCQLIYHS